MKTQFFKRTAIALVVGGAAAMSFSVTAAVEHPSAAETVLQGKVNTINKHLDENVNPKLAAHEKTLNALTDGMTVNDDGSLTLNSDPAGNHRGLNAVFTNINDAARANSNSIAENGNKIASLETSKVDKTAFDEAMNNNGARLEAVDGRVTDLASTSVHKDDFNALSTKVDGKVEKTDFDTLSSKVNGVNAGLTNVNKDVEQNAHDIRVNKGVLKDKASKAYVDEKVDAKADKSEVAAQLDKKASMDDVLAYNKSTLDSLESTNQRLDETKAQADKNATRITDTRNKQTLQNARLANHGDRIKANEDQIAAINARHDKVDAEKQAKIEEELKSLEENLLQERKEEYAMLGAIADNVDEQINTLTDFTLHNFRDFDARLNRLDKQLKRGLAAQAALSGLFQPYTVGKFNATAAVGGYKSQQAVAVGAGYRFNDHVAAKAGVAFAGHGDVSYHAGVNFEW